MLFMLVWSRLKGVSKLGQCSKCESSWSDNYSDLNKLCYKCWEIEFNDRQNRTFFSTNCTDSDSMS